MNRLAIIQARMSSSRLPGKVISELSGRPLLQYMLERVQRANLLDDVVLATTTDPTDDVLEQLCLQLNLLCYRGSLHDVLDRFYHAATQYQAGVVVRLTADCPLIDPELIDLTIQVFLGEVSAQQALFPSQVPGHQSLSTSPFDFAANRLPPPWKRSLPIGLDVEVCSFSALERTWKEATEPHQREHVMPFVYEGVSFPDHPSPSSHGWYIDQGLSPRGFRVAQLNHFPDYGAQRWTVDTPEDLVFVQSIAAYFNGRVDYTWEDILSLLEAHPELADINASIKHKSAFDVDQRAKDS